LIEIIAYLGRKAFDENGNEKVEEDIIAECHESDKVKCCPVTGLFHAVE